MLFTEEEGRKHSPLVEKIKLAAKNGAAAVIFVNDRDMAGKDDPLMPYDYASESGPAGSIPVLHASRESIDKTLADKSLSTLEEGIDKTLKPNSFEVKDWSAKVQASIGTREIPAKNVVGFIEGNGPLANETVVIGAHLRSPRPRRKGDERTGKYRNPLRCGR